MHICWAIPLCWCRWFFFSKLLQLSRVSFWAMLFSRAPGFIHYPRDNRPASLFSPEDSWTQHSQPRLNSQGHDTHQSPALPDTLCGEYPENLVSPLRCLENEHSSSQKVTNATRPIFCEEEQDKSAKWKGSYVSTLIMVVCAITASARLIWENVFSPQIDRSRDGENPLYPAKMWSACWTSALDKNVPLSHTGAEQHPQQPSWAALHKEVQNHHNVLVFWISYRSHLNTFASWTQHINVYCATTALHWPLSNSTGIAQEHLNSSFSKPNFILEAQALALKLGLDNGFVGLNQQNGVSSAKEC